MSYRQDTKGNKMTKTKKEKQSVYVITQEAIYRHDIIGVWLSKAQALNGFKAFIKEETKKREGQSFLYPYRGALDGHHEYVLHKVLIGERIEESVEGQELEYQGLK